MAFDFYGNQTELETRNFGALAVIYPLLDRMKIVEIINQHLPADGQAEYDYGTTLSLLMAARLYSPVALSNVAAWAGESGADILWRMPEEKINDDRLARALDAFFQQRHSILAHLALHVSREFDVPLNEVHYDPTHLLFTGAYENSEPRKELIDRNGKEELIRSNDQLGAAHITKGRSTDDAPKGSLMTHVGLLTYVDEFGALPLFGHVVDGNQNGRKAVDEQWALMRKFLKPQEITMMSDRGTFSVGHLLRLQAEGSYAICSAPWGEFAEVFHKNRNKLNWNKASYLSIEQQRRRKVKSALPLEHYELAVLKHQLQDDATKQEIDCRLIFVFSSADQKVVRAQRQKHIDQIQQELEKTQANLQRGGPYSDEASVTRRVARIFGNKEAQKYFTWKLVPLTAHEKSRLPKPSRGARLPTHRFEFSFDEKAVKQDELDDGYSVIVTTVPANRGSADALFSKFRQQIFCEQVNREFKGPLAVRPVFLHTPERVEALVFLLIAVMTSYYLLQRLYRQSVPKKATEKERRTTTAKILAAFRSYALLVRHTRVGREIQPTRLTTRQREILQQLGFSTPAQFLSQRLPRPPT